MKTNKDRNDGLNRREFLKRLGAGAAVSTAVLAGCDSKNNSISGDRSA